MNNNKKKKIIKEKNLGVQILRNILCFYVVIDHSLTYQIKISYIFFRYRLHVPCFIIIAFFFSHRVISERNCFKIIQRFERLLIPYIIFPILLLFINNLSFIFFKISFFGRLIILNDLYTQLIIGRGILNVFWFQFYLIINTLLFVIISFLLRKIYLFVILHIYIISYIIKYKNNYFDFFMQFHTIVQESVGQIIEVIPMSVSGSLLAHSNILPIIRKNNYNKLIIYFSLITLFVIFKYGIFTDIRKIAFCGIIVDIGSILLFIIFYLIPFNNIKSQQLEKILLNITKYSQGIYSLHLIIMYSLESKINSIKKKFFSGGLIIYIVSYLISFIGEKLTKKTKLVYLFI